jgi:type VI protein secretion system component Hcp
MAMIFLDLKVDGKTVPGDSTALGFSGLIEIERMAWELTARQPGEDVAASTQARTHLEAEHLKLEKYFDSASTRLYGYMDTRKRFASATISVLSMMMRGHDGRNDTMLVVELKEGYIESIEVDARESGKAVALSESLTLSFRECKVIYKPADPTKMRRSEVSTEFVHTVEKA